LESPTRETPPKVYFSGKKKVKDGAGIAWWPDVVYVLKGGNTNEFWVYRCEERRWCTAPQMPSLIKRVKGGGALKAAPKVSMLFAFRGNNTREFWRYGPLSADGPRLSAVGQPEDVQGTAAMRNAEFGLRVEPNPFTSLATIGYSLAVAGNVSLKLYDITGKLVSTLVDGHYPAGSYSYSLLPAHYSLASGVYVMRLDSDSYHATEKLVIE
jgi:hypothetical protein